MDKKKKEVEKKFFFSFIKRKIAESVDKSIKKVKRGSTFFF